MIIGLYDTPTPTKSAKKSPTKTWFKVRDENYEEHLKYLIESECVIQAGPLHIGTEDKDDKSSVAIGDMIIIKT